jgi:hypothetical protein
MTTLDFVWEFFWLNWGAVDCIAEGWQLDAMRSQTVAWEMALFPFCRNRLGTRRYRNSHSKEFHYINGVGFLLDTSCRITDLELDQNRIGNEGASLLARSLENNACQTSHASFPCGIGDDGFIALVSALEQNTSCYIGFAPLPWFQ